MLRLLAAIAVLLCLIVGTLWVKQRSLIFPAPQLAAPLPRGFQQVALTTADGLTLKAAYREAQQGRPTIIFFHGNGDDWTGAAIATRQWAEGGYGVLLPEYRGYAGNPGSPSEQGLFNDGRAALSYLRAAGIEPQQIVIIGNSIGSGVATQMAAEVPPAALILISPFASLESLIGEKYPVLPATLLVRDPFDNLSKLPSVRAPIFLLHGTNDALIPHSHSERLAASQPGATLRLVDGAGHQIVYEPAAQSIAMDWLATISPDRISAP